MKRRIRNALAFLLDRALKDPGARVPIDLLLRLCQHFRAFPTNEVSLSDLLDLAREETPCPPEVALQAILVLGASGSLLRMHSVRIGGAEPPAAPTPGSRTGWLVALAPEAQAELGALEQRLQAYRGVLDQLRGGDRNMTAGDPLLQALRRVVACFNAGLFFEAHEILEEPWVDLPEGPLNRFLQGVIQICVGFHHAREGRFYGTVNQLGKGLEKHLGDGMLVSALDWQHFVVEVRAVREQLLARGALRMQPQVLQDIPRMPLPFDR